MKTKQSRQHGFTLIELMIVVAIIGILSAIAYPNYTSYVQKGKRTDAKVAIMQVAQAQERYFSINMKYAFDMATLGLGGTDFSENYTVTVAGMQTDNTTACASGTSCATYTIAAIPKSGSVQNNDSSCQKFTLTHTGVEAAENGDTPATDSTSECW